MSPADVLPRLDHGHLAATLGGLQKDYRSSRRPLLRHLIERRLKKAIISAWWMAGQSDAKTKTSKSKPRIVAEQGDLIELTDPERVAHSRRDRLRTADEENFKT